ncbi:hypothetical protein CC86DRAFT_413047 [Ophiobolus disseminans]|uniref:NACHT domain-containing protein n=1 Tax=Ophiobolus disseminans TaxID=1469910 RepID=A0A6A6ZEA9_9PLEO|nr:hypothetical protein CC86DRAFT_413047 [Ophiobolus disseminans]
MTEKQILLDLVAECEEAGKAFIAYLNRLVGHSSSKVVGLAKTTLKLGWSSPKIDEFVKKLDKLRSSLTLATVLAFRTSVERNNMEILAHFREIQQEHHVRQVNDTKVQSTIETLIHVVQDQTGDTLNALQKETQKSSDADTDPNYIEIKSAFERMIEKSRYLKLAMFIDGIDEFEGDHRDMSLYLRSISSPRIKLIVSRRPLNACLAAFADCPTLRLQDFTKKDMEAYVHGELSSHRRMVRLSQQFLTKAPQIMVDLVDKAENVFLWVKLVVCLLIEGLEDGDDLAELQARLEALPSDLTTQLVEPCSCNMRGALGRSSQTGSCAATASHFERLRTPKKTLASV